MISLILSICAAVASIVMLFLSERFPGRSNIAPLLWLGSAAISGVLVIMPLLAGKVRWHPILVISYAVFVVLAFYLGNHYYTKEAQRKATEAYQNLVNAANRVGWDIDQWPLSDMAWKLCNKYFDLPYFLPILELRLNGALEGCVFTALETKGFTFRNWDLPMKVSSDCNVFLMQRPKAM